MAQDRSQVVSSIRDAKDAYLARTSFLKEDLASSGIVASSNRQVVDGFMRRARQLADKQQEIQVVGVLLRIKTISAEITNPNMRNNLHGVPAQLQVIEKEVMADITQNNHKELLVQEIAVCRTQFSTEFQKVLLEHLPVEEDGMLLPKSTRSANTRQFQSAIELGLKPYQNAATLPPKLDLFSVCVKPFEMRFAYHFNARRPTNRLDKPEWVLQHIEALIEQYHAVMVNLVQPVMTRLLPSHEMIATHELIRALLPVLTSKLQSNAALLLENTLLLTHTIDQVKKFDDTLRENFGYCHRDKSYWPGISADILTPSVFETWLSAEEAFAKRRFRAIVEEERAFDIVGEADPMGCDVAANPSATKIADLFEAMTRLFAPVEDLKQRSKFATTIQQTLLIDYLAKIRTSTEAFESLTTGFSGGFPNADIAGKAGLQRLCRQLSGVSNVLFKLNEWSDDPFYIALDDSLGSQLFEQELEAYTSLKKRIEHNIVTHIYRELSQELRPYTRLNHWSMDENPATTIASTSTSSTELIGFYEHITTMFAYLASIATPVLTHRIYIALAQELSQLLMSTILTKNEFSRRGALQFRRDVLQMWLTYSPYVARPETGMRSIVECLILLSDGTDAQEKAQIEQIEACITGKPRQNSQANLESVGVYALSQNQVMMLLQRRLFVCA